MILDTNALSAVAEGGQTIVDKVASAAVIAIPAVVLGEYWDGIMQSPRRSEYATWIERMTASSRVLAIAEETAVGYAEIRLELRRAGTPKVSGIQRITW